ncbi:hypothetical protein QJS10_CPA16g00541 [Acorus calamus]|uniref:Uncharacterized protein n=1 Tax=Acorus calamus TaxID=4465 RepID=A0AAV9D3I8_ACOCL|nr:hypothetical protein QJS10_CPA16g00541 [Acorus calamus]
MDRELWEHVDLPYIVLPPLSCRPRDKGGNIQEIFEVHGVNIHGAHVVATNTQPPFQTSSQAGPAGWVFQQAGLAWLGPLPMLTYKGAYAFKTSKEEFTTSYTRILVSTSLALGLQALVMAFEGVSHDPLALNVKVVGLAYVQKYLG